MFFHCLNSYRRTLLRQHIRLAIPDLLKIYLYTLRGVTLDAFVALVFAYFAERVSAPMFPKADLDAYQVK